jgi:phosphoglycolate phosphatase-like HAD superfamily hydrolase
MTSGRMTRRQAGLLLGGAAALPLLGAGSPTASADPLPSWNDGPAKRAMLEFVRATTTPGNRDFVAPEARLATFDQDGTTWVEHPAYTQLIFTLDRVKALAPQHPEWKTAEPFATILRGGRAALANLSTKDLEAIVVATHTGMPVEAFSATVREWIASARDPRWKRPYPQLVYQPMLEVMRYLRSNGYRTCIVTGGGQDFVRAYAEQAYGVQPGDVIGSALVTKFVDGPSPVLMREGKVLLNNNFSGKPEDIYLFTGRRPQIAFGNSTGDEQMLAYTGAGTGARFMGLVLHDDAAREYAYGPAQGLPATKFGTFTQALYDEAKAKGWFVISMKNDWKRVFAFS